MKKYLRRHEDKNRPKRMYKKGFFRNNIKHGNFEYKIGFFLLKLLAHKG